MPGIFDTHYHHNNFIPSNNYLVDSVIILALEKRNQERDLKNNNNLPDIR